MSLREFRLRKEGYNREFKEKWRHTREIAYHIYLSIPEKGKKMPINSFMNLGDEAIKSFSSRKKELLKKAHEKAMLEAKKIK